jgi:hypothetical protein
LRTFWRDLKRIKLTIEVCVVEIFEFGQMESFIERPVAEGVVKVSIGVRV